MLNDKLSKTVNGAEVPLTDAEIAEFNRLEAEHLAELEAAKDTQYQRDRVKEYPPISDQLDMIYKDQMNGTTLWRDLISTIKAKHPKPIV